MQHFRSQSSAIPALLPKRTRAAPSAPSIVVVDAHAALATADDQFRLRVPASHEAYLKLLDLFAEDDGDVAGLEIHDRMGDS
ncbi:hypothetical protein [Streptomyces capitiformicae]|uniref:Uncharacterized protein n=1 Tax=Streptomyces capitiformicae TaxID=2014920 RepID=A0A918ZG81_9ACTN|nr:hypothetical protein [Streptomyces capitiformicae]GHE51147.1 hypothetical protein GCM10017771_73250 [Streptomyces capitiformicae]